MRDIIINQTYLPITNHSKNTL